MMDALACMLALLISLIRPFSAPGAGGRVWHNIDLPDQALHTCCLSRTRAGAAWRAWCRAWAASSRRCAWWRRLASTTSSSPCRAGATCRPTSPRCATCSTSRRCAPLRRQQRIPLANQGTLECNAGAGSPRAQHRAGAPLCGGSSAFPLPTKAHSNVTQGQGVQGSCGLAQASVQVQRDVSFTRACGLWPVWMSVGCLSAKPCPPATLPTQVCSHVTQPKYARM